MEIDIIAPDGQLPVERAWAVSMVIKSFKGRRDVEVHLFRPAWDETESEAYDWSALLGDPLPELPPEAAARTDGSRRVLLESFTCEERDRIIGFLGDQYSDKLSAIRSCALEFPIPLGLTALSEIEEGKDVGFILFERIPSYSLTVPLRGLYDLSQHKPLIEVEE